jgi:hypothetical protein
MMVYSDQSVRFTSDALTDSASIRGSRGSTVKRMLILGGGIIF